MIYRSLKVPTSPSSALQIRYLAAQRHFLGDITRVSEDSEGEAHLRRDQSVIVQVQGPAFPRKIVELTTTDGFENASLGDFFEFQHNPFVQPASSFHILNGRFASEAL